jgi:hypothetical protein
MRQLLAIVILLGFTLESYAGKDSENFSDWVEPEWVNPLEEVVCEVQVIGIENIREVKINYGYPNGLKGELVAKANSKNDKLFRFSIPAEEMAGLGKLSYVVEVTNGVDVSVSNERKISMGYEEDLEITANPPEVLWFPLGDKSAVVRYKACCNILGASIIAKRTPVNPMESSEGLPAKVYSDFIWLEPDALSASTAGLYFEFGFEPKDFVLNKKRFPTVYEYDWRDEVWEPVISFEIVDGKIVDFPATEGGVYVLGRD